MRSATSFSCTRGVNSTALRSIQEKTLFYHHGPHTYTSCMRESFPSYPADPVHMLESEAILEVIPTPTFHQEESETPQAQWLHVQMNR